MTNRMVAGAMLAVVVGLFGNVSARAELPPGSYDKLRVSAEEAVTIQVTKVTTANAQNGKDVTLEAKVLGVERSKGKVKTGDMVTIKYFAQQVLIPGPRPTPILAKDTVYPAFLNAEGPPKTFKPAAYGESFKMTPEDR